MSCDGSGEKAGCVMAGWKAPSFPRSCVVPYASHPASPQLWIAIFERRMASFYNGHRGCKREQVVRVSWGRRGEEIFKQLLMVMTIWSGKKHLDLAKGEHMLQTETLLTKIPSKFCHPQVNTGSAQSDFCGRNQFLKEWEPPNGNSQMPKGLLCPFRVGTGHWDTKTLILSLSLTSLWDVWVVILSLWVLFFTILQRICRILPLTYL